MSGTDSRGVLKLTSKTRLQPFQAYSRLYYDEKLKPIVDEKYKEHIESVPKAQQKSRFAFSAALTRELFDAESEEVKNKVEVYRKSQSLLCALKLEEDEGEEEDLDEASELNEERNRQMQA